MGIVLGLYLCKIPEMKKPFRLLLFSFLLLCISSLSCKKNWDIKKDTITKAKDTLKYTYLVGLHTFNDGNTGIVVVDPSTGYFIKKSRPIFINECFGNHTIDHINGIYYVLGEAMDTRTPYLTGVNIMSGEIVCRIKLPPIATLASIAYNPKDGKIYGHFLDHNTHKIGIGMIDLKTGTITPIVLNIIDGIAEYNYTFDEINGRHISQCQNFDSSANCFKNYLYVIDVQSGAVKLKKNIGMIALAYNNADKMIYGSKFMSGNFDLISINPLDGSEKTIRSSYVKGVAESSHPFDALNNIYYFEGEIDRGPGIYGLSPKDGDVLSFYSYSANPCFHLETFYTTKPLTTPK